MKKLLLFLFAVAIAAAAEVDLSKPVPVIRLADGRVLKNVTFAKFNTDTVLTRSNLGPLGVRYDALPDDIRAAAEKQRPGGPRWFPGDTSGNTEKIDGQIFIQTVGASSYKFGNVDVYAFDIAALTNFDLATGKRVYLPKPIHTTTTDADGKFILKVPLDRPYFIFAQASRGVADGASITTERYEWRIPMNEIRQGKLLVLSQENKKTVSAVDIEKVQ